MSNPTEADATPIRSMDQLAAWFAADCKPPEAFGIGTEHEKFGFRRTDLSPPPYEPAGIRAVLEGIGRRPGWAPIRDQGRLIGLQGEGRWRGASVSLEPGGQFELSVAVLPDLHATKREFEAHFAEVGEAAAPLELGFAPLGFHPTVRREQMPWMPKSRYAIMRRYMPERGTRGLDMMLRTCTVQANLDYASESDMVAKLRVSLLLQPVATALFANSPFTEGRPNGLLSVRAAVWTDTDPDRTGIPAVAFEDGFGFARYVEWLLDVPTYFVVRDGRFVDVAGASFRDHLAGRLEKDGVSLAPATMGDFADHVTTVFTDVRLKRFLEMRGADAGSPEMMLAQSALWVGLLYDPAALAAAASLLRARPWRDFAGLRSEVPRLGLAAPWGRGSLRDLAREVVAIAVEGLHARARRNHRGDDEAGYLAPLEAIVAGGPTQAERWLERYRTEWDGDLAPIFPEAAI